MKMVVKTLLQEHFVFGGAVGFLIFSLCWTLSDFSFSPAHCAEELQLDNCLWTNTKLLL